jgi:hypothetical protein
MRYDIFKFGTLAVSFVLFSATAQGSPDLINGKPAPAGLFPQVVSIDGCTATKVGPRHFLYAAHCVFIGPGAFKAPKSISVSAREIPNPRRYSLKVKSAHLHSSWLEGCRTIRCTGFETGTPKDHPGKVDLALIVVEDETPEIPEAEIDYQTVEEGDRLVLAGYGCTQGINSGGSDGLRYGFSRALGANALKHPGSLYAKHATTAARSNVITAGTVLDPNAPALCPGDSGGPLFRATGAKARIVGVAGDYTFKGRYESYGSIPVTNLHTRLDDNSLHEIGPWLRERL